MLDYRGCFLHKSVGNDILVELERILDYAGVGLERFNCNHLKIYYICLAFYSRECHSTVLATMCNYNQSKNQQTKPV